MRRSRISLVEIVAYAGFGALLGVLVGGREWLGYAVVVSFGLVMARLSLSTWKLTRDAKKLLDDLPGEAGEPSGPRETTEAMLAVDALDEAISEAPDVPFTDQVRLERRRLDGLLDRLRTGVRSDLIAQLEELIQRAKPIPLTDQIRLDRDEVYDIVDRMRASFAESR